MKKLQKIQTKTNVDHRTRENYLGIGMIARRVINLEIEIVTEIEIKIDITTSMTVMTAAMIGIVITLIIGEKEIAVDQNMKNLVVTIMIVIVIAIGTESHIVKTLTIPQMIRIQNPEALPS